MRRAFRRESRAAQLVGQRLARRHVPSAGLVARQRRESGSGEQDHPSRSKLALHEGAHAVRHAHAFARTPPTRVLARVHRSTTQQSPRQSARTRPNQALAHYAPGSQTRASPNSRPPLMARQIDLPFGIEPHSLGEE
jgi:hypothetical protein